MNNQILSLCQNNDLARIRDDLTGLLRYTININTRKVTDEAELVAGASKIGGWPDLPPDRKWPEWDDRPIPLVAQIRLSDIAPYDLANELPHSGMLYFFFQEEALEGYPPERESWQVIYYDGDLSNLQRTPATSEEQQVYPSCALEFSSRLTLPPFESTYIENLGLSYEAFRKDAPIEQKREVDAYNELIRQLDALYSSTSAVHQLLGHPYQLQGDLLGECQQNTRSAGDPGDWQLLLQISSDNKAKMMWGDVGLLYFCIPREALAANDFSQVHLVMQCC